MNKLCWSEISHWLPYCIMEKSLHNKKGTQIYFNGMHQKQTRSLQELTAGYCIIPLDSYGIAFKVHWLCSVTAVCWAIWGWLILSATTYVTSKKTPKKTSLSVWTRHQTESMCHNVRFGMSELAAGYMISLLFVWSTIVTNEQGIWQLRSTSPGKLYITICWCFNVADWSHVSNTV